MINKHYCKRCYRSSVDGTADDRYLLMSGDNFQCPLCRSVGPVVSYYFKYGEQRVKPDGKHLVGASRHVGVNPNYSFFGTESIYPPEEQKH